MIAAVIHFGVAYARGPPSAPFPFGNRSGEPLLNARQRAHAHLQV